MRGARYGALAACGRGHAERQLHILLGERGVPVISRPFTPLNPHPEEREARLEGCRPRRFSAAHWPRSFETPCCAGLLRMRREIGARGSRSPATPPCSENPPFSPWPD